MEKNNVDKQYKIYLDKIKFDSTGKWCKPIKNNDNEYYHPEPYSKEEFIIKINNDNEFSKIFKNI